MLAPTDPLFSLQATSSSTRPGGSAVTGVCFVSDSKQSCDIINDNTSDDESSDESDYNFQCSNILLGQQHSGLNHITAAASHSSAASHANLQGYKVAACHHDGICKIWDLSSRRVIVENINKCQDRQFGLAVRRLDTSRFLYQTRDASGTVTLHDLTDSTVEVMKFETKSSTFCTVSPCKASQVEDRVSGGECLVAMPTELHSMAIVQDLRCNPSAQPAFRIHVGQDGTSTNQYNRFGRDNKYGMLMSLALSVQHDTGKLILGCGMEDGSVFFYDLGASAAGRRPWLVKDTHTNINSSMSSSDITSYMCNTKLGKEPVLSLDIVTSYTDHKKQTTKSSSLVAVAGCAGDPDEICDLPQQEQGTVITMKVSLANDNDCNATMTSSIRERTQTCSISSGGKVGVSIASFRPDGRVFAVGGWDRRLRIFGRTTSKPLAVLHGAHSDSVSAMDWADDSAVSGLLATGAGDGKICVYRVLPHTLKNATE